MSLKKFFVLFCPNSTIVPVMYKTQATIRKHIAKNESLNFEKFNSAQEASTFLNSIKSSASETAKEGETPTPPQISQAKSPISQEKGTELDFMFQAKLQAIKSRPVFKGYSPSPLLRSPVPQSLNLFFDGSSRYNPGPSAIGYVAKSDDNKVYFKKGWGIGNKTNNDAEYTALAWGLLDCVDKGVMEVRVLGDSELVLKSMSGLQRISNQRLFILNQVCHQLQDLFMRVRYTKIDRSTNKEADELARKASGYFLDRTK